jgi:hypothetical protein
VLICKVWGSEAVATQLDLTLLFLISSCLLAVVEGLKLKGIIYYWYYQP